jgi:hypothetical protein
MTDFAVTRRLRCRECKTKLPSPTANDNHAFCCKGDYAAFYRHRCVVCERGNVRRLLCHRLECRSAYRANRPKFTFPGQDSGSVNSRSSNADGMGIKNGSNAARGTLIGPHDPPINILGGYRWPGAARIDSKTMSKITRAEIAEPPTEAAAC